MVWNIKKSYGETIITGKCIIKINKGKKNLFKKQSRETNKQRWHKSNEHCFLGRYKESYCANVTLFLRKIQILTKTKWNHRFSPMCLIFI